MSEHGLTLELHQRELARDAESELSFRIVDRDGRSVTDFAVEHERMMHLIIVRHDLTGFQHLHPEMAGGGTWSTPVTLPEAGRYRVFADFNHAGASLTLGSDLLVEGEADYQELPSEARESETGAGYEVRLRGEAAKPGEASELVFDVTRGGQQVQVEPYLGADGHLVALREGNLAFLHVHPVMARHGEDHDGSGGHHHTQHDPAPAESGPEIRFMVEYPSAGRYRLFLQFKHEGDVHTAEFTRDVSQ